MNNRHRRVAKLKKQELNVLKTKFEKEYGVSAEEVYRVASKFIAGVSRAICELVSSALEALDDIKREDTEHDDLVDMELINDK
ncbi:toxin PIN [Enterococcus lactis]|uniref:toxin PIN n=1 Tax=Enterococcus lactis TaxID=357441 RepID=UPI004042FF57